MTIFLLLNYADSKPILLSFLLKMTNNPLPKIILRVSYFSKEIQLESMPAYLQVNNHYQFSSTSGCLVDSFHIHSKKNNTTKQIFLLHKPINTTLKQNQSRALLLRIFFCFILDP